MPRSRTTMATTQAMPIQPTRGMPLAEVTLRRLEGVRIQASAPAMPAMPHSTNRHNMAIKRHAGNVRNVGTSPKIRSILCVRDADLTQRSTPLPISRAFTDPCVRIQWGLIPAAHDMLRPKAATKANFTRQQQQSRHGLLLHHGRYRRA